MQLQEVLAGILPIDYAMEEKAKRKMNLKAKPVGSLGVLESIAVKMAVIQNNLEPAIQNKSIFIFAGDHGVTREGVAAFPPELTPRMIRNTLLGGAAINALCRRYHIDIKTIDIGVNFDLSKASGLIHKKVGMGTRNFCCERAMTHDEAVQALQSGIDVFTEAYQEKKIDIIGLGDIGIGNKTSSSAVFCAVTGLSPEMAAGRGPGVTEQSLANKIEIIKKGLELHQPDRKNAIDILEKVGGFEIGGIAGAILAAAYYRVPVVLDGVISTAGGLLAYLMNEQVKDYLFVSHEPIEEGQKVALNFIGLSPILDLNIQLAEATGAALAIDIIDASCQIMREMASIERPEASKKAE